MATYRYRVKRKRQMGGRIYPVGSLVAFAAPLPPDYMDYFELDDGAVQVIDVASPAQPVQTQPPQYPGV